MNKQYVCTLDEATQKKAQDELNEIPSDRMNAVKAFRDWINNQRHFVIPDLYDADLLLFLRGSKFSQLRARQMLEGNFIIRSSAPEWFINLDTTDPKFESVLNDGYVVPLPGRTKDGCQVVIYRPGCLDANMKRYSHADTVRASIMIGSYISRNELTQIHGSVFVFDFTGFTAKHMTNRMNAGDMKKFHKLWQKNVPGRFKQFHYYNAGVFLDAFMTIIKPLMDKKYVERMKMHDNLESLYKYIPMEILPDEYLPDDYKGPKVGTVKQIIENVKKDIQAPEFRNRLLETSDPKWGIDESKRPKQDQDVQESFRKLNVD